MRERLSIDGRAAVEVEVTNKGGRWTTSAFPLTALDPDRDDHDVVIQGGERDCWESVAKYYREGDPQLVSLHGSRPFDPPEDDDPNRAAFEVVRRSTEGR
jgi:hypothetical protein